VNFKGDPETIGRKSRSVHSALFNIDFKGKSPADFRRKLQTWRIRGNNDDYRRGRIRGGKSGLTLMGAPVASVKERRDGTDPISEAIRMQTIIMIKIQIICRGKFQLGETEKMNV
jgi:hypothetical protein